MRNHLTSLLEHIHKKMTNLFQFEESLIANIGHPDFRVRLALLRHPYCSQKYLHNFLDDPNWQVLSALAERRDLPEELYRYLYKHKKGKHYFLDFVLEQHELKKIIGIDSESENP